MNQPLVTIIIPCYNSSAFVSKAVDSILNQTYNNLEIILIDDASTDDTLKILKSFKDPRIKLLEFLENTKKIGAVNEALKIAKGDFIAFQDSDDYSEPRRIEFQVGQFLADNTLGICFTNYRFIGDKNYNALNISLSNDNLRSEFLNYKNKRSSITSPTSCPTMMISREVYYKVGGYHPFFAGRVGEDAHWIYRILKYFRGITINEISYNYTVRENSLMSAESATRNIKFSYSLQLLSIIIKMDIEENIDVLNSNNSELVRDIELQACEQALSEKVLEYKELKCLYENSSSYKIGKMIIAPVTFIKRIFK